MISLNKINHDKWVEIYNSILFLIWYRELLKDQSNHSGGISKANAAFNKFCVEHKYITDNQFLERGTNNIFIGYMILVRIKEIFDKSEVDVCSIYSKSLSLNCHNIDWGSFQIFCDRYSITDLCFPDRHNDRDHISLRRFIKHTRHSIAHFSYDLEGNDFTFESKTYDGTLNLKYKIPAAQYINFITEFGVVMNHVIRDLCYLEE